MRKSFILLVFLFISVYFSFSVDDRVYYLESKFNYDLETRNFEQIWGMISDEEKLFLTKEVGKAARAVSPPNLSQRMRSKDESIVEDRDYLENMAEFIDCFPEEMPKGPIGDFFIKKAMQLLQKMDKNMFLRVNPEIFSIYHKIASFSIFDKFKKEWDNKLPAFIPEKFDIITNFRFHENSDVSVSGDIPSTRFSSLFKYGDREFGAYTNVIDYPDYVKMNSRNFADVLNQLSNHDKSSDIYSKVNLILGNENFTVSSGEDFIERLYNHPEYDVVLYEARVLVSFGGLSLKTGGNLIPIEFPFYVMTRLEDEKVFIPMDHSEHVLVVYKKGNVEPLASVKWYMAMGPDKNNRQGVYFEEALIGGPDWTGYKVTHIYDRLENIKKFISVTTAYQQFINYVQKAYNFPDLGYGMLAVCNDSTSVIEVALSGENRYNPIPNLRAVKFDYLYRNFLGSIKTGLKYNSRGYLNVVSDTYPEYYKISRTDYIKRLAMSIPFRSGQRVSDFRINPIIDKINSIDAEFSQHLDFVYQD